MSSTVDLPGRRVGRPALYTAGVGDAAKLPLIESSVAAVIRKRLER